MALRSGPAVFNDLLVAAMDEAASLRGVAQLEAALKEIGQLYRSFVMEVLLLSPDEKAAFRVILAGHEARIRALEQNLQAARKASLLGKQDNPVPQREDMLAETVKVQALMDGSLQRTRQRAAETVLIGRGVADALEEQGDQIVTIDQITDGVNGELALVRLKLATFARQVASDKLFMCLGAILFTMIIVVVALTTTGTLKHGR